MNQTYPKIFISGNINKNLNTISGTTNITYNDSSITYSSSNQIYGGLLTEIDLIQPSGFIAPSDYLIKPRIDADKS